MFAVSLGSQACWGTQTVNGAGDGVKSIFAEKMAAGRLLSRAREGQFTFPSQTENWYAACAEKTDLHEEWKAMWFLGMDVGTGGTRAVVVDANGKSDQWSIERACALSHASSRLG